jgi:hypothetical protein
LVGFDAPETGNRSKCTAERVHGHRAAIRLIELLDGTKAIDLTPLACSCPKGTQGTSRCNYKRACAELSVDVGRHPNIGGLCPSTTLQRNAMPEACTVVSVRLYICYRCIFISCNSSLSVDTRARLQRW